MVICVNPTIAYIGFINENVLIRKILVITYLMHIFIFIQFKSTMFNIKRRIYLKNKHYVKYEWINDTNFNTIKTAIPKKHLQNILRKTFNDD